MKQRDMKIIVRCPKCDWRIFDKVTQTTGTIELKCPNCRRVVEVDLSLRRTSNIKYRLAAYADKIGSLKQTKIDFQGLQSDNCIEKSRKEDILNERV